MARSISKGFKPETIAKIISQLKEETAAYVSRIMAGENVWVSISSGNRKIGRVLNVSLAPILTCGDGCKFCKSFCYDVKACLQYGNVRKSRARNTALAIHNRKEFFRQIKCKLERTRNTFFRWHVSGDILDADYFDNMVQLAIAFPQITFWTYTKQYHIVNKWIDENGQLPENLHVMFSQWKVKTETGRIIPIPFPNPHNMPVFTVRFEEEEIPQMFKCPGNCDICKSNHCGCIAGQSTYNDAH